MIKEDILNIDDSYDITYLKTLSSMNARSDTGIRFFLYDGVKVYIFIRVTGYTNTYCLENIAMIN
jgi:hypothetical protein